MNAYGSTLDSLSANALAQDQVAQQGRNAYRQYLLGIGQLGQRGREIDSMDRYRQGELDVRRDDVGGMNEFRRGQVDIGRRDATTRQFDAESLDQYRRGEIDQRRRGLDVNRELGLKGIEAQNAARWDTFIDPIRGAQARLLDAQADALKRGGGFSMLPRDAQNLAIMDEVSRKDAAGRLPLLNDLLNEEEAKIRGGSGWLYDSGEVNELQAEAGRGANGSDEQRKANFNLLVRKRAAKKALQRAGEIGIDPSLLTFDERLGGFSVGESPYRSLLSGQAQPDVQSPSAGARRFLPTPGQSSNPNPLLPQEPAAPPATPLRLNLNRRVDLTGSETNRPTMRIADGTNSFNPSDFWRNPSYRR